MLVGFTKWNKSFRCPIYFKYSASLLTTFHLVPLHPYNLSIRNSLCYLVDALIERNMSIFFINFWCEALPNVYHQSVIHYLSPIDKAYGNLVYCINLIGKRYLNFGSGEGVECTEKKHILFSWLHKVDRWFLRASKWSEVPIEALPLGR